VEADDEPFFACKARHLHRERRLAQVRLAGDHVEAPGEKSSLGDGVERVESRRYVNIGRRADER
jgi:hypothetical protein